MLSWIESLTQELGSDVVSQTAEDRQRHSVDVWPLATKWQQQGQWPYSPEAIVRPQTVEQVSQLVRWANRHGIPLTPWGAGSSVTGAPLPLKGGICVDMAALHRIVRLDTTNLLVTAQAGMLGHHLEAALNERGCTLNHSPQSLDRSTVGGWVSTFATGQFSSRWGGIEEMLLALTVVLPTGDIVETPLALRAALGPDIKQLFVGAEGALGIVTDATLRIAPLAEHRVYETLAFGSIGAGLLAVRRIMQKGLRPFLVRFYDGDESKHLMGQADPPGHILLLGFEGVRAVAEAEYEVALDICREAGGQALGPAAALRWMGRRFDFSTVENLLQQDGGLAETIEVAHFWDGIEATYHALKAALAPLAREVLGHFSHVYPQGTSLYMILLGEAENGAAAAARLGQIWETAMRVSIAHGATISHHHGIGIVRLPYVRQALGTAYPVLERIKRTLDPQNVLNPGKLGLD